jgi:hypothetical protein
MRGRPALASRSSAAEDEQTARGLWALSERLTGVSYALESSVPVAASPGRAA